MGLVDGASYQQVGDPIDEASDHEHGGDGFAIEAGHIGVVIKEIQGDHLPYEVAGEIGCAIADPLPPQKPAGQCLVHFSLPFLAFDI